MKSAIGGLFLIICLTSNGQSFWEQSDTLKRGRLIGVTSAIGATWSGSMIGLGQFWYKGVEKSSWHSFDDSKDWLQMDKVGHFYTAYKINDLVTNLYRWSGFDRRKSLWIGSGVSFGYQLTFEMFDAFSAQWGFSWADVGANSIGTVGFLLQDVLWDEERIIPKFSYHSTDFASVRPHVLGSSFAESLMKDYNGQTYWLSFSPGTFMKNELIPEWLCFSLGYSAHAKVVGSEEYYLDELTGLEYNSSREFLFSLDIDFSRLPIKRKWIKQFVQQLNYLKFPFPSLILRDGKILAHPLYF